MALYHTAPTAFVLANLHAHGGVGGQQAGAAGTIYVQDPSGSELRVDAEDIVTLRSTPLVSIGSSTSTGLAVNTLTDAAAAFVPGQLVGLALNPDLTQTQTFRVIANDATTITTDPADGDLRAVAAVANTYGADVVVDQLTIARHALVELGDGNATHADRRGRLRANGVTLSGAGRLSHPIASPTTIYGLELDIDGTLAVDASSSIDVDGRGYLSGRTSGLGDEGRTEGNSSGSTGNSGASYGGLGGLGSSGTVNPTYGNPLNPDDAGSGLVRIDANRIELNGTITANGASLPGGPAAHGCTGGSSGGGIKLTTGVLTGTGTVHANGQPSGGGSPGSGGGGRIAVFAPDTTGFPPSQLQALGGAGGFNPGQPGTVHVAP